MASLTLLFWNLYNLFDPRLGLSRGPQSEDELDRRLAGIAATVAQSLSEVPHLIGVAEVGDARVFERLRARMAAATGHAYHGVWHSASGENSGQSGLGLLGRSDTVSQMAKVFVLDVAAGRPRFMVASVELIGRSEPILVVVNHWKSRLGGTQATDADRIDSARMLGERLQLLAEQAPSIICMGDFNAEPFEKPFSMPELNCYRHHRNCGYRGAPRSSLYNASWRFLTEGDFVEEAGFATSLEPRPKTTHDSSPPALFDQMMFSKRMLFTGPYRVREGSIRCLAVPATINQTVSGSLKPARWDAETGQGVSDHFALVAELDIV